MFTQTQTKNCSTTNLLTMASQTPLLKPLTATQINRSEVLKAIAAHASSFSNHTRSQTCLMTTTITDLPTLPESSIQTPSTTLLTRRNPTNSNMAFSAMKLSTQTPYLYDHDGYLIVFDCTCTS